MSILWIIVVVIGLIILGSFAYGSLSAAPWLPLWKKDVNRMLKLADVKPGETVYDLGAGDGRIVIAAAKNFKANAKGFELAVLPYLWGYIKIKLQGVDNIASLHLSNFFKQDFSNTDVVCAFLTPDAMRKLKPKLDKELKLGSRFVTYAFPLPDWEPTVVDKPNEKSTAIYLYQR